MLVPPPFSKKICFQSYFIYFLTVGNPQNFKMLPVRRAGNMWMVHMKRNPAVGLLGKNAGATTVVIPNRTIIEIFQQVNIISCNCCVFTRNFCLKHELLFNNRCLQFWIHQPKIILRRIIHPLEPLMVVVLWDMKGKMKFYFWILRG